MLPKAVFLDKDGTLIENVPYNVDPDQIRLMPGAIAGLKALHAAGYQLIVITNQSGVAHGRFPEEALIPVQERIRDLLAQANLPLAGFYYCPHHPDATIRRYATRCFCRKPSPGLLFQAAREHGLNLASSWFIGDILNDVEAGRRADVRTVLIDNGNETEWNLSPLRMPHHTVPDFLSASQVIMAYEQAEQDLGIRPVAASTPGRLHRTSVHL